MESDIFQEMIKEKLESLDWYKKSGEQEREDLLCLGNKNNFLIEKIIKTGNAEINSELLKIIKITQGNEKLIVSFQFRSRLTNQLHDKEIVFDKYFNSDIGRGIVLISVDDKISWVVTGNDMNSIKMKFPSFSTEKTLYLPTKLEKWLKGVLGEREIVISNFIDLGEIETLVFAAVIKSENKNIKEIKDCFEIYKINDIDVIINNSRDSIVVSALSRLKLRKVI